jgi:hypothetical protein
MGQRSEQGLIEQLVPQAADEGLGKGILHGLSRRDVMPSHLVIVRPLQDDVRGQFGAVVGDNYLRRAAIGQQPIEFSGDPHT